MSARKSIVIFREPISVDLSSGCLPPEDRSKMSQELVPRDFALRKMLKSSERRVKYMKTQVTMSPEMVKSKIKAFKTKRWDHDMLNSFGRQCVQYIADSPHRFIHSKLGPKREEIDLFLLDNQDLVASAFESFADLSAFAKEMMAVESDILSGGLQAAQNPAAGFRVALLKGMPSDRQSKFNEVIVQGKRDSLFSSRTTGSGTERSRTVSPRKSRVEGRAEVPARRRERSESPVRKRGMSRPKDRNRAEPAEPERLMRGRNVEKSKGRDRFDSSGAGRMHRAGERDVGDKRESTQRTFSNQSEGEQKGYMRGVTSRSGLEKDAAKQKAGSMAKPTERAQKSKRNSLAGMMSAGKSTSPQSLKSSPETGRSNKEAFVFKAKAKHKMVKLEGMELIFAGEDRESAAELVNMSKAEDMKNVPLLPQDRWGGRTFVLCAAATGTIYYERSKHSGNILKVDSNTQKTGDILVCCEPQLDDETDGIRSDRAMLRIASYDMVTGSEKFGNERRKLIAMVHNAILADYPLKNGAREQMKAGMWALDKHVSRAESLEASISEDGMVGVLIRPNMGSVYSPSYMMQGDGAQDRLEESGSVWVVKNTHITTAHPGKHTGPPVRQMMNFGRLAQAVDIKVRGPVATHLFEAAITAFLTIDSTDRRMMEQCDLPPELEKFCREGVDRVVLIDPAAGVPGPKAAMMAALLNKAFPEVEVSMMRVDPIQLLYTADSEVKIPADVNSLTTEEAEERADVMEHLANLRQAAAYAPEGFKLLQDITLPMVVHVCIPEEQALQAQEALEAATRILAVEVTACRYDQPDLTGSYVKIGEDVILNAHCWTDGSTEGSESTHRYVGSDKSMALWVRKGVFERMEEQAAVPEMRWYARKFAACFENLDSVGDDFPEHILHHDHSKKGAAAKPRSEKGAAKKKMGQQGMKKGDQRATQGAPRAGQGRKESGTDPVLANAQMLQDLVRDSTRLKDFDREQVELAVKWAEAGFLGKDVTADVYARRVELHDQAGRAGAMDVDEIDDEDEKEEEEEDERDPKDPMVMCRNCGDVQRWRRKVASPTLFECKRCGQKQEKAAGVKLLKAKKQEREEEVEEAPPEDASREKHPYEKEEEGTDEEEGMVTVPSVQQLAAMGYDEFDTLLDVLTKYESELTFKQLERLDERRQELIYADLPPTPPEYEPSREELFAAQVKYFTKQDCSKCWMDISLAEDPELVLSALSMSDLSNRWLQLMQEDEDITLQGTQLKERAVKQRALRRAAGMNLFTLMADDYEDSPVNSEDDETDVAVKMAFGGMKKYFEVKAEEVEEEARAAQEAAEAEMKKKRKSTRVGDSERRQEKTKTPKQAPAVRKGKSRSRVVRFMDLPVKAAAGESSSNKRTKARGKEEAKLPEDGKRSQPSRSPRRTRRGKKATLAQQLEHICEQPFELDTVEREGGGKDNFLKGCGKGLVGNFGKERCCIQYSPPDPRESREMELEFRLERMWTESFDMTAEMMMGGLEDVVIGPQVMYPVLHAMGCLYDMDGVLPQMADWMCELGKYRSKREQEIPTFSIPILGLERAIEQAQQEGWLIVTGDGSGSGPQERKKKAASSATVRIQGRLISVLCRVPQANVQTNNRAEVGAAWSSRVAPPSGQNVLYVSDSEYTLGVMAMPDSEFAAKLRNFSIKNALNNAMLKMAIMAARGITAGTHIMAHGGCELQDVDDVKSRDARELPMQSEGLDRICLEECALVLETWDKESDAGKEVRCTDTDFVNSPAMMVKTRMDKQQQVKLRKSMEAMNISTSEALSRVNSMYQRAGPKEKKAAREEMRRVSLELEKRWRFKLLADAKKIVGVRVVARSDTKAVEANTREFLEKVQAAQEAEARVKVCKEKLNKMGIRSGGSLMECMVQVAGTRVVDPVLEEATIGEVVKALDKYTHQEEKNQVLSRFKGGILPYAQCWQVIEEAQGKAKKEMKDLTATREDDVQKAKIVKMFGQWKHQGASRSLFRKFENFTAKFEWINRVEPLEFLKVIVGKAETPEYLKLLATQQTVQDLSWIPERLQVTEDSQKEFAERCEPMEIRAIIMKGRLGIAVNPVTKVTREMLRAMVELSKRIEVVKAVVARGKECEHRREILEDARRTSEEVSAEYVLAEIINNIEITGQASDEWNTIVIAPIRKPKLDINADISQAEFDELCRQVKNIREVALADAGRGIHGSFVNNKYSKFATTNKLHRYVQLAYVANMDAIRVHQVRLYIMQALTQVQRGVPWAQKPISLAMFFTDLESYFSLFDDEARDFVMWFNNFPDNRAKGVRAMHKGKKILMVKDGKVIGPLEMKGELMGSAEAVAMAAAASSVLSEAVIKLGKGFVLPGEEYGLPRPPQDKIPALFQCDDKSFFAGGVGISPQEMVSSMEHQARLLVLWAVKHGFYFGVEPLDPVNSKSIIFITIKDEYGFSHQADVNIWLPAKTEMKRVPVAEPGTSYKSLGVWRRHFAAELEFANEEGAKKIIIDRLNAFVHSSFPAEAQQYALQKKVTGGLEWAEDKVLLTWEFLEQTSRLELQELKAIIGLTSSTLGVYVTASKQATGCGYNTVAERALVIGPATMLRDLNSNDEFVKGLERYAVEMFRVLNGIGEDDTSGFLNWDIKNITTKTLGKLTLLPEIALAIRAHLKLGVQFKKNEQTDVYYVECVHTGKTAASAKKVREIIKAKQEHDKVLLLRDSTIDLAVHACRTDQQMKLTALWRSKRILSNAQWKFANKMLVDALPTPRNISFWKEGSTTGGRCVCGEYGNLRHCFQRCPRLRGEYVCRHNALQGECEDAVTVRGISSWMYTHKRGCHPPEGLLPKDWRSRLPYHTEVVNGVEKRTQHRLPDWILIDGCARGRMAILIVEFQVTYDDIETAAERKTERYNPLKDMIQEFLGSRLYSIEILPIVFTSRGTPPQDWSQICSKLKIKCSSTSLLLRIQVSLIEHNMKLQGMWTKMNEASW